MYNDIIWRTPGNEGNGVSNSVNVATYAKRFPFGCWSYRGPGCEKKWYGTCEREGIVRGDEGPVSGVAQVVCHGVKVVGVHGEEGREEDGEVQGEVKGEVEQLREKRSSWMVWR